MTTKVLDQSTQERIVKAAIKSLRKKHNVLELLRKKSTSSAK